MTTSVRQQTWDCPHTGAVPGLCGVNRDSFMARKLLGQPPMTLGTVPSLLQCCSKERHSLLSAVFEKIHGRVFFNNFLACPFVVQKLGFASLTTQIRVPPAHCLGLFLARRLLADNHADIPFEGIDLKTAPGGIDGIFIKHRAFLEQQHPGPAVQIRFQLHAGLQLLR